MMYQNAAILRGGINRGLSARISANDTMLGSMYGGCDESTRRAAVFGMVILFFAKHQGQYIDDGRRVKRIYLKKGYSEGRKQISET
jgi:hypothetical protein